MPWFPLFLAVLLMLQGCALPPRGNVAEPLVTKVEGERARLSEMQAKRPVVQVDSGLYLGGPVPVILPEDERLPPVMAKQVTLVESGLYLHEIAQRITQLVGLPVRVAPRPKAASASTGGDSGANAALSAVDKAGNSPMRLLYTGPLRGLLDSVSAHYGMHWEYQHDSGAVQFYYLKTKTFSLVASGGKTKNKSVVSNKSGSESGSTSSGSGSGSSNLQVTQTSDTITLGEQTTELSSEVDIWALTTASIKGMLSRDGEVVPNEGAGTITVTDTPAVLHRVEEYVRGVNLKLSRQVALVVKVYSVEQRDQSNHQLNLTAVLTNLKNISMTTVGGSPISPLSGVGSLTAVLQPIEGSNWGHWAGSEVVLEALNTWGKTALITSGSGVTLHNQALPIQVVQRTTYLAGSSQTLVQDTGTTSTLTAGQVTTGFALTATPNILDNNQVVLQYSLSLSQLDDLKELVAGSGDNEQRIQLPQVSTRSFQQRVAMRVGSTLVLGGFEQADASHDDGVGVLAVGRKATQNKRLIVITIDVNAVRGASEGA